MNGTNRFKDSKRFLWLNASTKIVAFIAISIAVWTFTAGNGGSPVGVAFAAVPVTANDFYSTGEDTTLTVPAPGILVNDTDADHDVITPVLITGPINGALTLNLDGSFTYNPHLNFHGIDSFTYKANDGTTDSNIATVNLIITSINDVPVADNDAYTLDEDTPLNVAEASLGLLANDQDDDKDSLAAILVTNPAHGTLALYPDGTFTYNPNANYHGTDSFTYKANDDTADSNTATVSLTINPVSDAPVALPDSYSTAEDTSLVVPASGVLSNDFDADKDVISITSHTDPAHGTLQLSADGSFTYAPAADYQGTDTFQYRITAGSITTGLVTVTITVGPVNDAPVAHGDAYVTNEDTTLQVIAGSGVLANDADIDSASFTAVIVTNPAHGSVTLNQDGSFTYNPNPNYNGADSFTYKANDGTADSTVATVTLTINPVNDLPVATADTFRVDRNAVLNAVTGVLGNDNDIDGNTLTAALVTSPGHGILVFYPNGTFTYTPNSGYMGTDSFTYRVNDGTANSAEATVTLTINTVPVATDKSYSINEDTTLTIAASGVLNNDYDPDGSSITAVLVTGPAYGTLTLNPDGSFVYTPWTNHNGWDSFTYRAYDGIDYSATRTASIAVNSINDVPVAYDDSYEVNEDTTLAIQAPGVLVNDWDGDGNQLAAYLVSGTSHGTLTLYNNGSFRYVPSSNYNGEDTFRYTTGDGSTNSSAVTVWIRVNGVNDLPVIKDPAYPSRTESGETIRFSLSFSDAESGNTHSAVIYWGDGAKSYGGLSENSGSGTVSGEHAYSNSGKYRITVILLENGGESIMYQSDEITVTAAGTSNGNSNGGNQPAGNGSGTITPTPASTTQPSTTPPDTPSSSPQPSTPGSTTAWPVLLMIAFFVLIAVIGAVYLLFLRPKG